MGVAVFFVCLFSFFTFTIVLGLFKELNVYYLMFLAWLVTACVGGSERPCHGNGVCDGDGTREGNGKCSCNHGYTGEFCLDCIDGHFNEARNDTFSLCTGDSRILPLKPVSAKPV